MPVHRCPSCTHKVQGMEFRPFLLLGPAPLACNQPAFLASSRPTPGAAHICANRGVFARRISAARYFWATILDCHPSLTRAQRSPKVHQKIVPLSTKSTPNPSLQSTQHNTRPFSSNCTLNVILIVLHEQFCPHNSVGQHIQQNDPAHSPQSVGVCFLTARSTHINLIPTNIPHGSRVGCISIIPTEGGTCSHGP